MSEAKEIKPQEGFQQDFLSSPADIIIGGGAAGAGKTYALLMEPLRHVNVKGFGGVIFRRTSPQITSEGGLWDTSLGLWTHAGGTPIESKLSWRFPKGTKMKFSHLEYEKNVLDWQGSQIPFIGFDEVTHFSEKMFFYLLSRNRSACGIKPYVRATCNPDPDSWVANFIEWWIEQDPESSEYGFPIKERCGKLRYFMRDGNNYVWGDSKKEVLDKVPHIVEKLLKADPTINTNDLVKSITFIPGSIYNNVELLRKDPGYLGNLMAQSEEDRASLLDGNWKISSAGNDLINYVKLKDTFTNDFIKGGRRCITADIALKGSDLLVICVWDGWRLIDIDVVEKTKGDGVIKAIKALAHKYKVPQSEIVYDDDGAGSFIDGFIKNARAFKNGAKARKGENYTNLKTQMYFKIAEVINNGGLYISPEVANKMVKGKTIMNHIIDERRAIKRDKIDDDRKLCIIPKAQMKNIIGHSPDFLDAIMMRFFLEYFTPAKTEPTTASKESYGFF